MKCYFSGHSDNGRPDLKRPGIISFAIPDLGITYRAALRATPPEFPYKALLALTKFLESNRKVWYRQSLELYTDYAPVVYQVLGDMEAPRQVRHALGLIRVRKQRLGFRVAWVAAAENRACENVSLHPIAKPAAELNFSSLQDTNLVQSASQWKAKQQNSNHPKI